VSFYLLTIFTILSSNVSAHWSTPDGTVTINPPVVQGIDLGPSGSRAVIISGHGDFQVMGVAAGVQLIQVELDLLCHPQNSSWNVSMEPRHAIVDPKTTSTLPFSITVRGYPWIPAGNKLIIEVVATSKLYPGDGTDVTEPAITTVIANQHFLNRITLSKSYQKCHPGDGLKFNMRIENNGNGISQSRPNRQ